MARGQSNEPEPGEDPQTEAYYEATQPEVVEQQVAPSYVSDGPGGFDANYHPDQVVMHHPDLKDSTTTVSKTAFDEVWADKGWVEGEAEVPSSDDQG